MRTAIARSLDALTLACAVAVVWLGIAEPPASAEDQNEFPDRRVSGGTRHTDQPDRSAIQQRADELSRDWLGRRLARRLQRGR